MAATSPPWVRDPGILPQGRHAASEEEEALRTGISLGLTLIDTAELYGGGRAEQMIGRVIAGQRDKVFLVSKVAPYHAAASGIRQACVASLARLGTDYLDLYLLHWRDGASALDAVVDSFESLRAEGRIRRWGVSNFYVGDMEDLYRVRRGDGCATNQVRYNLKDRSIEQNLLPLVQAARVADYGLFSARPGRRPVAQCCAGSRRRQASKQPGGGRARLDDPERARHQHSGSWLADPCAAERLRTVAAVDGSRFG